LICSKRFATTFVFPEFMTFLIIFQGTNKSSSVQISRHPVLSCLPHVGHARVYNFGNSSLSRHIISTMSFSSSDTIDMSAATVRDDRKTEDPHIPEIPSHWIFKRDKHPVGHAYFCWSPFLHFLHHLFCVIGLGHASLHEVWKTCHPGCSDEVWEHGRDRLRERLEHINIVVRLSKSDGRPLFLIENTSLRRVCSYLPLRRFVLQTHLGVGEYYRTR
jgi:hypothetical protein